MDTFAKIVERHIKHADVIKTFSWGTLNFTTKIMDIDGNTPLKTLYSDVVDLMDNFDMMSYEMPISYTKLTQKECGSYSISPLAGWQLSHRGEILTK